MHSLLCSTLLSTIAVYDRGMRRSRNLIKKGGSDGIFFKKKGAQPLTQEQFVLQNLLKKEGGGGGGGGALKPVDNGCGTGQDVLPHEDYCSKSAYGSLVSCDDPNHTLDMTESLTLQPAEKWLGDQVRPQMAAHADTFAAEYPAIKFASDPSQFSRGTVVGMCVQDPRFFTPSKKTDMVSSYYPKKKSIFTGSELPDADSSGLATPVPDTGSPSFPSPLGVLPSKLAYSPIWNEAICKAVSKSKIPDHLLNQKRSEKLVKCSSLNLADAAPQIPAVSWMHWYWPWWCWRRRQLAGHGVGSSTAPGMGNGLLGVADLQR